MLSCICPHVGEEMWQKLGHTETIAYAKWPEYDESKMVEDTIEIGVQVNGKVKGTVMLAVEEGNDTAIEKAKQIESVARAIEGKTVVKAIYVKGRIVNLVVK